MSLVTNTTIIHTNSQLEHGPDEDYMYGPMPDWIEAYHGADITYVFGIPLLQDGATYSDPEVKFSMDMMKLWSNFAKTGSVLSNILIKSQT